MITQITDTNRTEADKLTSECKLENQATSAYLRLARVMDSSKVDTMCTLLDFIGYIILRAAIAA